MNKVIEKIKEYEMKGISDIQMIALVSDTSAEVIFYGVVNGTKYQSNNMVEEGKIDSDVVNSFYDEITTIVRSDNKFDSSKMNIFEANANGLKINYDERKCKIFDIIRKWEERLK